MCAGLCNASTVFRSHTINYASIPIHTRLMAVLGRRLVYGRWLWLASLLSRSRKNRAGLSRTHHILTSCWRETYSSYTQTFYERMCVFTGELCHVLEVMQHSAPWAMRTNPKKRFSRPWVWPISCIYAGMLTNCWDALVEHDVYLAKIAKYALLPGRLAECIACSVVLSMQHTTPLQTLRNILPLASESFLRNKLQINRASRLN